MQSNNNDIGTAEKRNYGDLPQMVAINEDIKAVMRIADEVNLAAINAMLITNRIGTTGSGFGVVSAELRTFSRRLGDAMRVLVAHVYELVREVAGMTRLNKSMQLQLRAQACATHYVHMDEILKRKANELARSRESIERCRERSFLAVGRAGKLCHMGRSLSYSAKIEAVHGGAQTGELQHVTGLVESAIVEILSTLGKLGKQLNTAI